MAHHHVGWLQVSVNDLLAVCVGHGMANLLENGKQMGELFEPLVYRRYPGLGWRAG
jgi:hypothetical protein